MNGVFMHHAAEMLKKRMLTFLYIFIFLALLTGFVFLILMEFRSFWAGGSLKFDTN